MNPNKSASAGHISDRCAINLGGEAGIRTLGTREGTLDFESSPFDHSGTSPWFALKRMLLNSKSGRRDGDSNPGYAFGVYTLSRRAP